MAERGAAPLLDTACNSATLTSFHIPAGATFAGLYEGLEQAGFIVIRATDGNDALGHLRHASLPSLVLLDLLMPGMNGWQLCEAMHADPVLSEIPIVALSTTASMDPESLHLAEVADWIAKPFELADVLGVIRPFLAARATAARRPEGTLTPEARRLPPRDALQVSSHREQDAVRSNEGAPLKDSATVCAGPALAEYTFPSSGQNKLWEPCRR